MSDTLARALIAIGDSTEATILLKATLIMMVGLGATQLAGKARASVRHVLLASTFAAVLLLPFAVMLVPAAAIPIAVDAAPSPASPAATPTPAASPRAGGAADLSQSAERSNVPIPTLSTLTRIGWAAGCVWLVGSLGVSLWKLSRLRRFAYPWRERYRLVNEVAAELGLRRQVCARAARGRGRAHHMRHAASGRHPAVRCEDVERRRRAARARARDGARAPQRLGDAACRQSGVRRVLVPSAHLEGVAGVLSRSRARVRRRRVERRGPCGLRRSTGAAGSTHVECVDGCHRNHGEPERFVDAGVGHPRRRAEKRTRGHDSDDGNGDGGIRDGIRTGSAPRGGDAARSRTDAERKRRFRRRRPATAVRTVRINRLDQALYEASKDGDIDQMTALINAGANPNASIQGDGSPLMGAARSGNLAAVRFLLDRGVDPNLAVRGDGTALIVASRAGQAEVATLLLDRGADLEQVVPGDENALIQASGSGKLNVARLLVSRGANVNARVWADRDGPAGSSGEWRSPLLMAKRGGHQAVVEFLISSGAIE